MKQLRLILPKNQHAHKMMALRFGINPRPTLWGSNNIQILCYELNTPEWNSTHKSYKHNVEYEGKRMILCANEDGFIKTALPVEDPNLSDEDLIMMNMLSREGEQNGYENDKLFTVEQMLTIRSDILDGNCNIDDIRQKIADKAAAMPHVNAYVPPAPAKEAETPIYSAQPATPETDIIRSFETPGYRVDMLEALFIRHVTLGQDVIVKFATIHGEQTLTTKLGHFTDTGMAPHQFFSQFEESDNIFIARSTHKENGRQYLYTPETVKQNIIEGLATI